MNILFIGDIVGRIGRQAVAKILPQLIKEKKIDLVIANAENSAHGSGISEDIIKELMSCGIDYFTMGDHAFRNRKHLDVYNKYPIVRPANFSNNAPGQGHIAITIGKHKLLLVNLIGQVFMKQNHNNPFYKIDEILANKSLHVDKLSAIIIDIHAETTSEKIALGHYLNGRVAAVLGTHSHVMTADAEIKSKGTAYITDVGMVGAADECLGVEKDGIIRTFLTQIREPHVIPEQGRAVFNAVLIKIRTKTRHATEIKSILKFVKIK